VRSADDGRRTRRKAWAKPLDEARVLSRYEQMRRKQSFRNEPVTIPAAYEPLLWEEALSQNSGTR
jgi:hypothetical protein